MAGFDGTSPWVLNASTAIVLPGAGWTAPRPELDIIRLEFRAWAPEGQLVEGCPNGCLYFLPHGIPYLWPINVLWSTKIPVFYVAGQPVLACESDFVLLQSTPSGYQLTVENVFPNDPILRTIGGPLDLRLLDGNSKPETLSPKQISSRNGTRRAVNAFIAYRSLYAVYLPLCKQMDVSGMIRNMWAAEPEKERIKFQNAARAFTIVRDAADAKGRPRPILKDYLIQNLRQFQLENPRKCLARKFVKSDELSELENFLKCQRDSGKWGERSVVSDRNDAAMFESIINVIEQGEDGYERHRSSPPSIRTIPEPCINPIMSQNCPMVSSTSKEVASTSTPQFSYGTAATRRQRTLLEDAILRGNTHIHEHNGDCNVAYADLESSDKTNITVAIHGPCDTAQITLFRCMPEKLIRFWPEDVVYAITNRARLIIRAAIT
ncbi:hypothetical protein BDZ91DRAFT_761416 [Kalaharituber pfeilii]|nr:hypothetical protein BDZ91DRAFT_761416 [Kalaharituber pfeilii]